MAGNGQLVARDFMDWRLRIVLWHSAELSVANHLSPFRSIPADHGHLSRDNLRGADLSWASDYLSFHLTDHLRQRSAQPARRVFNRVYGYRHLRDNPTCLSTAQLSGCCRVITDWNFMLPDCR